MIQLDALPKFYHAVKEHREVEKEIHRLLKENLPDRYTLPDPEQAGFLKYTQKNFFSILFLSIYRALDIPPRRRLFYGLINHCLRGLVTGTDNLLDNEYKEMLPLAFPATAIRFKSVMHILLFDRFLFQVVEKGVDEGTIQQSDVDRIHKALFAALVPIGAEESLEEGGISEILPPEEILSSVHMYKGGGLLCLSFVAPGIIESQKTEALQRAKQGVYSIGMALQIIDDLTDFYEDIRDKNNNYLVSFIHHQGTEREKDLLAAILGGKGERGPIETVFEASTRRVMKQAIGEALKGFDILHETGYWLTRKNSYSLIRYLFKLRGVANLLPMFPARNESFAGLDGIAADDN